MIADRLEKLESLRELSGMRVDYAQGVDNELVTPAADSRLLSTNSSREVQGLQYAIYANAKFAGKPASSGVDTYFNKLSLGEGLTAAQEDPISARWTARASCTTCARSPTAASSSSVRGGAVRSRAARPWRWPGSRLRHRRFRRPWRVQADDP